MCFVPYYKVNHCEEAFAWYQDVNLVYLVDGVKLPYSQATLEALYSYLDRHGELFWIEVKEKGEWFPIGDITLSQDNLPIVIGNSAYQHRGLGKKILSALIELARVKGWKELRVKEIYTYNHASRRCFKSLGFVENGATEKGRSFIPNFKLKLATQKKFTWRLVVQAFFRVVVNPIFDKSYFFRSRFLGSFR
ncbi:sortase-like acyltransferase [Streptococcus pneumoniae]|nr:sortase-like acyltransferase [Streptococcus pneumoniae]CEW82950.1 sortase-like acyltransferase [Streptococcus pneumoniae]CEY68846.1 sortase-like acyltransferase [Streptococcus pneumoniae]CGG73784.1 sortase-like acyltransferase [Streptococcus pneumoniae]CIO82413.1 sortase-like acyltransferase [Streptococcus pneumoniae]